MTHNEREDFLDDIAVVAARTEAVLFTAEDEMGAVQYALYPRRKMPLERAVVSPLRRGRRRRGLSPVP